MSLVIISTIEEARVYFRGDNIREGDGGGEAS